DFDLELRLRIGDLDSLGVRVKSIEHRLHQTKKVGNFFANYGIGFDHGCEIFQVLLNVARKFVGVIGSFGAGENSARNTLRMAAHGRKREMSSITDGPETDLICAECLSQILEIVGAFVRVVASEVDALDVAPVG